MLDFFQNLNPIMQALIATCFTWGVTAVGASLVFVTKSMSKKLLDGLLGFTGGVMIAASYWSLLAPSIEMSADLNLPIWFPAATGFLLGMIFLRISDRLIPHLHLGFPSEKAEGIKTSWRRTTLLVLAITLHNIPEGLAVGVAFGAVAAGFPAYTLPMAIALAIGIGLQNFPEGIAVAMPLRREGVTQKKSFWYGQLSAVVEPIAGIIGAAAVIFIRPILPYALSFAAGAMVFVVVEDVIPECQLGGNTDVATMGFMLGFVVMMVLDIALA